MHSLSNPWRSTAMLKRLHPSSFDTNESNSKKASQQPNLVGIHSSESDPSSTSDSERDEEDLDDGFGNDATTKRVKRGETTMIHDASLLRAIDLLAGNAKAQNIIDEVIALSTSGGQLWTSTAGGSMDHVRATRAVANAKIAIDILERGASREEAASLVVKALRLSSPSFETKESWSGDLTVPTPAPCAGKTLVDPDADLDALCADAAFKLSMLTEIEEAKLSHEQLLQLAVEEMERLRVESNDSLQTAIEGAERATKKHVEAERRLTEGDDALENKIVDMSPKKRAVFTAAMDVLQSRDPVVEQLMSERARLAESERAARAFSQKASSALAFRRSLCGLIDTIQSRLNSIVEHSREASQRRAEVRADEAVAAVARSLPKLRLALGRFLQLQAQRSTAAGAKLIKTRQELEEHNRLYGEDEAPSERRELERRVHEYESIVSKSREAIKKELERQRGLWSPTSVPLVLQRDVAEKLQTLLSNLEEEEHLQECRGLIDGLLGRRSAAPEPVALETMERSPVQVRAAPSGLAAVSHTPVRYYFGSEDSDLDDATDGEEEAEEVVMVPRAEVNVVAPAAPVVWPAPSTVSEIPVATPVLVESAAPEAPRPEEAKGSSGGGGCVIC